MPKLITTRIKKLPKLVKMMFAAAVKDEPKQEIKGEYYDGYPYLVVHRGIDGDSWKISHVPSGMRIWSYEKKKQALEILWEINHLDIPWSASVRGIESYRRRHSKKIEELRTIAKRYSRREPY